MCGLPVKVMAALVAYIEFDAAGATNGGGGGGGGGDLWQDYSTFCIIRATFWNTPFFIWVNTFYLGTQLLFWVYIQFPFGCPVFIWVPRMLYPVNPVTQAVSSLFCLLSFL